MTLFSRTVVLVSFLFLIGCNDQSADPSASPQSDNNNPVAQSSIVRYPVRPAPTHWEACPTVPYTDFNGNPGNLPTPQMQGFFDAISNRDTEGLKQMVQQGVNPDCYFQFVTADRVTPANTPLCMAIIYYDHAQEEQENPDSSYFETIRTLLDLGADPNARCADNIDDDDSTPTFVEMGAGAHPLFFVVNYSLMNPDLSVLKLMMEHGANVNSRSWADTDNQEISGGVSSSILNDFLQAAYFTVTRDDLCGSARANSYVENILPGVKMLLDNGANPNPINKTYPDQSLQQIIGCGDQFLSITQLLLQYGANPELKQLGYRNACDKAEEDATNASATLAAYQAAGYCR